MNKIIEQALIYQCACPAQVAELLLELRRVEKYESDCLNGATDHLADSHILIAREVAKAHHILEDCLDKVLDIEGWDRGSYHMPEGLRSQKS